MHKLFLPATIPLIVLGSLTFRDIYVGLGRFSAGQPLFGTFIGGLIVITTTCNLFSSILPLKNSPGGDWYYESKTLTLLAPKNCVVLGWGNNIFSLRYHFNRPPENTDGIRMMYEDYYLEVQGQTEPDPNEYLFKGRSQKYALIRLGFLSQQWFKLKYEGYLPLSH